MYTNTTRIQEIGIKLDILKNVGHMRKNPFSSWMAAPYLNISGMQLLWTAAKWALFHNTEQEFHWWNLDLNLDLKG